MPTQKDFDAAFQLLNNGPLFSRDRCTVADGSWILERKPGFILDKDRAYIITFDNEITEL